MSDKIANDLSEKVGANLPFLRRYARAPTGFHDAVVMGRLRPQSET